MKGIDVRLNVSREWNTVDQIENIYPHSSEATKYWESCGSGPVGPDRPE